MTQETLTVDKDDAKATNKPDSLNPPYIPWKSFDGFIAVLKSTHLPNVIDGSVMPASMAGGLQRQIRSALKFLGLTDANGKVTSRFGELVKVHGTAEWPMAVKEHVVSAYQKVVDDLPIATATMAQLDAKFKAAGANGQVLDKAIRFYVHALKAGGVKYSSYLAIRKQSSGGKSRKKRPEVNGDEGNGVKTTPIDAGNNLGEKSRQLPAGAIEFPLHFGDKVTGMIVVPQDMDENDLPIFDAMVAAVKAFAGRKRPAK